MKSNKDKFEEVKGITVHNGIAYHYPEGSNYSDLFIIIPEPELTKFEQEVRNCIIENLTTHGREMSSTVFIDDETAKKLAAELLGLARNQLQKEGLVTMTHLNKACEAEYQSGLADGKNEALNDLPRWEKCGEYTLRTYGEEHFEYRGDGHYLVAKGMEILLSDIEKLPRFKED